VLAGSIIPLLIIGVLIMLGCSGSGITTVGTTNTLPIGHNYLYFMSAQAQTDGTTDSRFNTDYIFAPNSSVTFSAIGQISSLVITVQDSGFNITDAFKVVLTGDWNLSVNNGTVTNFALNFLASPMEGSRPHIHQITNFKPYIDEEPIILTEDKSLSVNGTADIKINGIVIWDNADVSIAISKGNTFSFDPDDKDTEDHFGEQQVYGIVTRLIKQ
jgi:hypothetical protein